MTFYLHPPSGVTQLQVLETICKKRLQFLLDLQSCEGNFVRITDLVQQTSCVEHSECLIEGTKKDRAAHFILRMLCSSNPEMNEFFLCTETTFFNYRVSCMTYEELHTLLANTVKAIRKALRKEILIYELKSLLILLRNLLTSTTELVDSFKTGGRILRVPFHYVPKLIANRVAVLEKGVAHIDSRRLNDVLTCLFGKILKYGLMEARTNQKKGFQDPRMNQLFGMMKAVFYKHCPRLSSSTYSDRDPLYKDQVDTLCYTFPLCMRLQHRQLNTNHRLPHLSRIQYTLFLKEAGMPVHDALRFWQEQYSKPFGTGNCCHKWVGNERRYTYNIRHLYGLEGSRINYRGHSCHLIQNQDSGCPYKHYDEQSLRDVLGQERHLSEETVARIIDLKMEGLYRETCALDFLSSFKCQTNTKSCGENCSEKNYLTKTLQETEQWISSQYIEASQIHSSQLESRSGMSNSLFDNETKQSCKRQKTDSSTCSCGIDFDDGEVYNLLTNPRTFTGHNEKPPELGPKPENVITITKPIDYFSSYTSLLSGLK